MWTEKNVVSYVPIGEARAMRRLRSPEYQAHARQRGTGLLGCRRLTVLTAQR